MINSSKDYQSKLYTSRVAGFTLLQYDQFAFSPLCKYFVPKQKSFHNITEIDMYAYEKCMPWYASHRIVVRKENKLGIYL